MARRLPPVTAGAMLLEEFLKPMGISRYRLAKEVGVPRQRISEVVARRRAITADTDLRLCCPSSLRLMPNAEGDAYARFVVETLKPYVDGHYRTLPQRGHTAIAGSSAGAKIAFHIASEYPDLFSKVGALGFAMGKGAPENNERWCAEHRRHAGTRLYLHVSTAEGFQNRRTRCSSTI